MSATVTQPPGALAIGAVAGTGLLLVVASSIAVLTALIGQGTCAGTAAQALPSARAERSIPPRYLRLYREAGHAYGVPWPVLAAIGSIETDHGRSTAPGVRSGLNRHGCCAGPMQFNTRDGPRSTWTRYGVDGNGDGRRNIYDPGDAIASAANYLRALLRDSGANVGRAIFGYNHSQPYVDAVLARAHAYARMTDDQLRNLGGDAPVIADCASADPDAPVGPANVSVADRVVSPRTFRTLPSWALAGAAGVAAVDARIHDDVVWILHRYRVRVTAAREAGHETHGDGTAVDLVPADGSSQAVWDASAGRLAHDLGWTRRCARSGSRPVCPLAPAIQFIGYDGYPGHGSPRSCSRRCRAHLHISWVSPCYGSSAMAPPCAWVLAFPVAPTSSAIAA